MFVQIRKWVVTEGNADKVIERFKKKPGDGPSLLEQREGFIGREILVKNVRRGEEEVIMMVRWESEDAWTYCRPQKENKRAWWKTTTARIYYFSRKW